MVANTDKRHAIHNPIRISARDKSMVADVLKRANDLKTDGKYWARPMAKNMYGMPTARPMRVVNKMKTPKDIQHGLGKVRKELTRP